MKCNLLFQVCHLSSVRLVWQLYSSLSGSHQTLTCRYWSSEPLKQHKRNIPHSRVTQNKGEHGFPTSSNTALTDFMISNLPPVFSPVQTCLANGYSISARISGWRAHGTLTVPFPSHPSAFFSKVLIRSAYHDEGNFGVGKNTKKTHKVRKKDTRWHSAPEDTCSFYFSCYPFTPLCFPLFPFSKEMWEVVKKAN